MSVVLAATHDGELLRRNHASLVGQCFAVGGHVLLADGTEEGLPEELAPVVHLPGADVFTLRARAAALAVGRLIAVTEDHCLVDDDWVEAIIAAHGRLPDVTAIGGVVANGSTATVADRANFSITFAPFEAPLPSPRPRRAGPATNIAYKRERLDASLVGRPGHLELEMLPHLHATGDLQLDERIRAVHVQPRPGASALVHHFHNGRSCSGLHPRDAPAGARLRAAAAALRSAPGVLVGVRAERAARGAARDRAATAAVGLLAVAHAVGGAVGALRGPGASPTALE